MAKDVLEKEIKDALFSMKIGKSPGLDGFSVEFSQRTGRLLRRM